MPRSDGSLASPPRKGLRLDQLLGGVAHFVQRQEQQAVLVEEGAAIRAADNAEQFGIGLQLFGEPGGGGFRQLGRLAVDHHRRQVGLLREGGVEARLAHAPAHLGVDQLLAVGVDGEILAGVPARAERQKQTTPQ